MGKMVKVKDIVLGEGLPKICVPMVGENLPQLLEEAYILKDLPIDMAEWRVDFFKEVLNLDKVKEALQDIRNILPATPIIFTFRSAREGGAQNISTEYYMELNKAMVLTRKVDIIDVELFNKEKDIKELVNVAHANGVAVIISNHDFQKTPAKEEIVTRLLKAIELGGDLPKIAVMPNSTADVLTLLDATRTMKEEYEAGPIITMSMGGQGVISRLSGELFGSALTFGAARKASAPGQIAAADLRQVIELLHNSL
ncbi:MAG: type I 3-dehydroquinate dehydratase [Syntrophomonadaceae bacterium]